MIDCPRYLHSLYCDDVRMEVGGKMTFVGVYQSQLIVQQAGPVGLPKLCIVATAQTPKSEPFEKLSFKLFKDDEVIQTIDVPSDGLVGVNGTADEDPNGAFHIFGAVIALQPFNIDKSCVLRVRAETEAEVLEASALRVTLQPPPVHEFKSNA